MKKKILISALLTIALLVLGTASVMADPLPAGSVQFSNEQIKLAQLNWNAAVEMSKNPGLNLGPITHVNPDSVIGKAAIINTFGPALPYSPASPVVSNPYFNYYPFYCCTYQYR